MKSIQLEVIKINPRTFRCRILWLFTLGNLPYFSKKYTSSRWYFWTTYRTVHINKLLKNPRDAFSCTRVDKTKNLMKPNERNKTKPHVYIPNRQTNMYTYSPLLFQNLKTDVFNVLQTCVRYGCASFYSRTSVYTRGIVWESDSSEIHLCYRYR